MGSQNSQGIREPKQTRSIEKKNRIIDAGLELFKEKGYHNVNTADIAAKAGVSTGTVYSYFKDKKAILLESLNVYYNKVMIPLSDFVNSTAMPTNLNEIVSNLLEMSAELHRDGQSMHEEMTALAYTDEDIGNFFSSFEVDSISKITNVLKSYGISTENLNEKVLIAFNLFESYCHESAFHQHSFIDYDVMKKKIVNIIVGLFNGQN